MSSLIITEKDYKEDNLLYIQNSMADYMGKVGIEFSIKRIGARVMLKVDFPEYYSEILGLEIADKIGEIIAINYKNEFFKKSISISGLSKNEEEILFTSLIAADLDDDKRYIVKKILDLDEIAIDGVYNFRLQKLKQKWKEIASVMPSTFVKSQLKDFISYLTENKRKKIFIQDEKVYDGHFRRLKRSMLLGGENINLVREVLLSNCGEIELYGKIPTEDEAYLREYYADKIFFSSTSYI